MPLANVYHIIEHQQTNNWEIIDLKNLFLRDLGFLSFFFFFCKKVVLRFVQVLGRSQCTEISLGEADTFMAV